MTRSSGGNGESHVGVRVRDYRQMRRLTLRALGEAAGVSPSFLSQLENGRTEASVGSLRRIAVALNISVADLFESGEPARHQVLRRADRPEVGVQAGSRKFMIAQPPLRHLEVYSADFEPGASTGDTAYSHGDAQEILLVLSGEVSLELDGEQHVLTTGDSIEYATSVPHRLVNTAATATEVLWIISPPTPAEVPVERS
ncbi:cupin domain-containing protein [Kitasatospora sp. GAS204B]|uniref:cupin domain-containing protein n=1 Tax=unclassified Kitasatospora TaxID=2633591 RepID=UPI002476CDF9|nr:cupin domain-containing protein [Kitasatospora sp. GAS204B]MDH6119048.1 transcriptional regulator with XRE-family HTH domain [Kitasatospora sp. GAS204B]